MSASVSEKRGVQVEGLLNHSEKRQGVCATGMLSHIPRGGVQIDGNLNSDRPGVHASGLITRTTNAAQIRLDEAPPKPQITLTEENPKPTFFQWVRDVNGSLYFITADDQNGQSIGWDANDINVTKTIDRIAKKLLKVTRNSTDQSDIIRYKQGQTFAYTREKTGTMYAEADMPRKDDRTFFRKLGGSAYESIFGPRFGPVRVGLQFGGTLHLTADVARQAERPLAELQHIFKSTTQYYSEKSNDARRKLATLLKRHAEQLTRPNTPVETITKVEAIEATIERYEAENYITFHEAVEVVNGDVRNLNPALFEQGKDVIVPITVVHNDGVKHAVSIYYEYGSRENKQLKSTFKRPTIYYYDSLGKSSSEGGAEAVIKTIQDIRPFKGLSLLKRPFFRQAGIVDAQAKNHQNPKTKDCARYSIAFFDRMVAARMSAMDDIKGAFTRFTNTPYEAEALYRDIQELAPRLQEKIYRGKRWHPDDIPTLADGTPHHAPRRLQREPS